MVRVSTEHILAELEWKKTTIGTVLQKLYSGTLGTLYLK